MQDALITLTGNVGTDVEYSEGAGWSLARFRLACTPRRVAQGVWVDQETTWIAVTVWGRMATNVNTSLAKGDPVVVTGKLRTSAWQSADGTRHERLVVEASAIGHDLARGTSTFQRTQRVVITDPQGDQIYADTGEMVDERPPSSGEGKNGDEGSVPEQQSTSAGVAVGC